jgi:hypothetical protein
MDEVIVNCAVPWGVPGVVVTGVPPPLHPIMEPTRPIVTISVRSRTDLRLRRGSNAVKAIANRPRSAVRILDRLREVTGAVVCTVRVAVTG